jgi:hypothetical protein
MDRRIGGIQSRSRHSGEEKNSQPLSGLESPDHPAPVAQRYTDWAIPAAYNVDIVAVYQILSKCIIGLKTRKI